jgi:hypothetical protein
MQRSKERGKWRKAEGGGHGPVLPLLAGLLPLALSLVPFLSGCTGDGQVKDDPLLGAVAPPPPVQAALPPAGAPVPPLPVSSSAVSTASLAAGTPPLEGGRELKMDDPRDKLVNRSTWQQAGAAAEKAAGGAALNNPVPIVPAADRTDMDPLQGLAGSQGTGSDFARAGSAAESLDQLRAQLKQRGMTEYHSETWGDGIRVVCAGPKKSDPKKTRSYEAYAINEIEAVKAIMGKIDADQ